MAINLHIQTKIDENNELKIANVFEITPETSNREIMGMCQTLRNYIRFMEDELYNDWLEGNDLVDEEEDN